MNLRDYVDSHLFRIVGAGSDPSQLTPGERVIDAHIAEENRRRYFAMSRERYPISARDHSGGVLPVTGVEAGTCFED